MDPMDPVDPIDPVAPEAELDEEPSVPRPADGDVFAGAEAIEPIAIDEPVATDFAGDDAGCAVPATATPPIKRAPARETAPTPDHHSRVARLARSHPLPNRSISVAMMRPPSQCPKASLRGSTGDMITLSRRD
jgi:hypothetical protein